MKWIDRISGNIEPNLMRGEGSVIATLGRVSRSMSCACRRYAFRQAIEQIVPPTMLLRTHVVREQACCFRPLNLSGVILFVSMFLVPACVGVLFRGLSICCCVVVRLANRSLTYFRLVAQCVPDISALPTWSCARVCSELWPRQGPQHGGHRGVFASLQRRSVRIVS